MNKKSRIYFFEVEGKEYFSDREKSVVQKELNWYFFHVAKEKFLPKIKYRYE